MKGGNYMKKRFTLSLVALIASSFLFVVTTLAWWTLNTTGTINPFGGNLSGITYNFGGEFIAGSVIFPELELLQEDVSITNYSGDQDIYVRIKIEYTKIDTTYDSQTLTYNFSTPVQKVLTDVQANEHLEVGLNSNFFYESDGYWYYDVILEDSITHTLITSLNYDGFKASNEYADKEILVSITLEITYEQEGIWSPITTLAFRGFM